MVFKKPPWNKGLTKKNNEVLRRQGENHSKILKKLFKEGKLIIHNKGKKGWINSGSFIEGYDKRRKNQFKEGFDERRIRTQFQRGHEVPQEWREITRKSNEGREVSEETRRKLSENTKLQYKINPNFGMQGKKQTEKWKEMRRNLVIPVKDTTIEVKIQNFLSQLKIEYFTHKYITQIKHRYQCDILIPSMNIVIECDGDYWHKYPIGTEIDHIRTKELIEQGFKVLRLWENEIRVMDLNKFEERLKCYQ